MSLDDLRVHHRARPFHPFSLHLADGHTLRVLLPYRIAFSPRGKSLCVSDAGGFHLLHVDEVKAVTVEETVADFPPRR